MAQSDSGKKETGNTERLALLKSRLSVAKKFCKKPHESWKAWINEYEIENFADTDEIRDKVRIGYLFRKIEQDQPAIFDDQPQIFIKGRNAQTREMEPLINSVYDYLWDIQDLEEKIEDAGVYFSLLGLGFIESPWVTKTKKVMEPMVDEMGNVMALDENGEPMMQEFEVPIIDNPVAEVPNPFKLYFSPETKFATVLDYEHCPYYFKEHVWTKDKVKAMFGKDVEENEQLKLEDTELDTEIEHDTTIMRDDMKRVTVYEYYGCLPKEMAEDIEAEEEWRYDKEYRIYMTKNEELEAKEGPYPVKPLFIVGNYGMANKFWKFGDAKHLIPLVQEYEMYRSQILGHTRKMANPKPLLPATAMVDEKAFADPRPGRPVKYSGEVPPSYLSPGQLGREVQTGIDVVKSDLEKTSGSFDLAGGSAQSTVKTPRGIQVYSEAADKNIRRKRKKVARLIRELLLFQFGQIAQNWKPEDNHVIEIMDESIEVNADVLQVLSYMSINKKIDIEEESLSINKVQQKQDALNLWDTAKENPDVFNLSEVAKDLVQNGYEKKDADRYLISEEQRAQMQQAQQPQPSVSIRVDATTPAGLEMLVNMGLLTPEQADAASVAQQQQETMRALPDAIGAVGDNPFDDPTQPQPDEAVREGIQN